MYSSKEVPPAESVFSSQRWKNMPLDDNKSWDNFIFEMRNNNTCPCECIKKINEEKKVKALKKLFNANELGKIKDRISILENEPKKPLCLIFNPEIPSDIRQLVEEVASDMHIGGSIRVYYGENNGCVHNDTGGYNLSLFKGTYPKLYPEVPKLLSKQRAVLRHEFGHIKKNHSKIKEFIVESFRERTGFNIKNPIISGLYGIYYTIIRKLPLNEMPFLYKFCRATEAEADREPAACGSYNDAKDSYIKRQLSFETSQEMDPNDIIDPFHPPEKKRMLWATLIMHAKAAEKRLHDYEISYSYKMKKLFNTLGQQAKIGIAYFLLLFHSLIKSK